jgi:hypothetical protein
MEYQIILPEIIGDEWQNIGIDFEPQSITGNIKGENIDKPIINLKKYAISLDNRYLKEYTIIKEETQTIIKIKI